MLYVVVACCVACCCLLLVACCLLLLLLCVVGVFTVGGEKPVRMRTHKNRFVSCVPTRRKHLSCWFTKGSMQRTTDYLRNRRRSLRPYLSSLPSALHPVLLQAVFPRKVSLGAGVPPPSSSSPTITIVIIFHHHHLVLVLNGPCFTFVHRKFMAVIVTMTTE